MDSAVYAGTLRHRRFVPRPHEFTYPLFMALLDIDRIPELMRASPFTSYNSWNWASFDERDHFGDPRLPLRRRLEQDAASQGIPLPEGPIFLLTNLRYLGYNFNPVSFFYCLDGSGRAGTILAEVNSTFGETHNYWLSAAARPDPRRSRHYQCRKMMHVSPFMPMDMEYLFSFSTPGERLGASIAAIREGVTVLDATLALRREPWGAKTLHRALVRYPWMTGKVIAAIHWEALRLFMKRIPLFPHRPGSPERKAVVEISS